MLPLSERVLAYLRRHQLCRAGDRVCAAVSGGADSVALLHLLLDLRAQLGIVLSVAHLDHQLRANSAADAAFVANLAAAHALPLFATSADTAAYAARHDLGVEAAGRHLRYQFFQQLIADGKVTHVATGHTADDQAETVLLRLIRGAGTRGLAGIHPARAPLPGDPVAQPPQPDLVHRPADAVPPCHLPSILRPLLSTRRADLRAYLEALAQPWREDPTNQDLHFARNRVRAELLPLLARNYNPSIVRVLSEAAEVARAEEEFWAAEVAHLMPLVRTSRQTLRCDALSLQPVAIQRRIVRAAAEQRGIHLDFDHAEQVLALAVSPQARSRNPRIVQLPHGAAAIVAASELRFESCGAGAPPGASHAALDNPRSAGYDYRLPIPGEVAVPEAGCRVRAIAVTTADAPHSPDQFLDPKTLAAELRVRNWRPGDRFWPVHTKAPRKVKELLQERQIAGRERVTWPVAVSGDQIVWIRGFPASQPHRATGPDVVVIDATPR